MVSHRNLKPARLPVSPHPHIPLNFYTVEDTEAGADGYYRINLKPFTPRIASLSNHALFQRSPIVYEKIGVPAA